MIVISQLRKHCQAQMTYRTIHPSLNGPDVHLMDLKAAIGCELDRAIPYTMPDSFLSPFFKGEKWKREGSRRDATP